MENLNFDPIQFVNQLPNLAKGMIGVFVVILLIILVTSLLNLLSDIKKK